ncbi:MAG: tetratricopeptide repeat protein [Chloroflexi bacterium]|nr:tetratricopeptide repeat protein [Chloroflexota bacterium]
MNSERDCPHIQCPYCGGDVPDQVTICPACHEDLAGLARLEYAPAIYYNEGLALAREGRLEEARDKLIVSTTLDDSFLPAQVLLAKVYARQENWPRAHEAILRALQLAPDDETVRELAAQIDQLAGEDQARRLRQERAAAEARQPQTADVLRHAPSVPSSLRELLGAFGLGMIAAALLGLVWRWLAGDEEPS